MSVIVVQSGSDLLVIPSGTGVSGPAGPPGSGSTIGVKNEGSLISSTVQRVNFTGAGKAVSGTGADVTIDIPGATGSSIVSVNDFGAVGDGTTDDSAAFVAAIAALKAAAVNTNGFYKASAKLTALPG